MYAWLCLSRLMHITILGTRLSWGTATGLTSSSKLKTDERGFPFLVWHYTFNVFIYLHLVSHLITVFNTSLISEQFFIAAFSPLLFFLAELVQSLATNRCTQSWCLASTTNAVTLGFVPLRDSVHIHDFSRVAEQLLILMMRQKEPTLEYRSMVCV